MVDWLVVWGVTQAAGVLVQPILADLVTEGAKDFGKDFFKDALKKVFHLPEADVQKEAYGKALKVFLELMQEELQEAGYQEAMVKQYIPVLKKFIAHQEVAAALGKAFEVECRSIDTRLLTKRWADLNPPHLPESFDWDILGKLYVREVRKIVKNSEKLRAISEAQTLDKIADGVQELAGIAPGFDLGRYAEGLQERYGNLKLDSLNHDGAAYNALKLWRIFVPQRVRECEEFIPQVYELPKDRSHHLRASGQVDLWEIREEEIDRYRQRYREQPIRPVFEVVGDPEGTAKYAVILGDPGSGKSTLLQYLALVWAEKPVRDLPLQPLPLLVELRTYARDRKDGKCQGIVEFIHGGNFICRLNQQELHAKLQKGDVIALFDGIDEVFDPELREEVVTDIHRFTNDYPLVRVVATSRWLGYKAQRLRDAEFQHFMLQDLDDEQVEDFLRRWHDLTFGEGLEKEQKRERLHKAIRESKSIHELAGNPLLLTMMAILNRNQELPRDRPELYNQASRVLLHQWDVERLLVEDSRIDPKIIDHRDKQAILRKVAHYMQSSAKGLAGNLIDGEQLEGILMDYLRTIEVEKPREIARVMINQLRTRNFILCDLGANSYGFVHRTFLEYFCAWEFVWQFEKDKTLTIEQLIQDVFGNHWQEESWHEVLRLICGMIEPKFVAEIIDFLLEQKVNRRSFLENDRLKKEGLSNLLLAADCFVEVRNQNLIAVTSSKLLKTLQHEAEQEYPYKFNSELAIRLVSNIARTWQDNSEVLAWLKKCLKFGSSYFVQGSAVREIAEGWKDDPDTHPWLKDRALNDQYGNVRRAAVEEIAKGWKDDPDTLPLLKYRALNDQDEYVRWGAVQEIAKGWKEDPDTLPLLKYHALNDQDKVVRSVAVEEIANGWKEDPDTLPLLKDRALNDQDEYVRRVAVREIIKGWKDDPDTLTLLKDRVLNDRDYPVRWEAVEEIAKGWKDDLDTLTLLKDLALNNQHKVVRSVAVREITKGWKDDPDTLTFLKDIALNDQYEYVRKVALREITKGWKDDPDTLTFLKDLALNDQHEDVRSVAVEGVAKGWKDDPDTLTFLKDLALNDQPKNVRSAAVEEISNGWKKDPDTLPWLKDRALNDQDEHVRMAAVEGIGQYWEKDPNTILFLQNHAFNDESWGVRRAVVKSISEEWKDNSQAFKFLYDCTFHDPFIREEDWQTNPRQTALEAILKYYSDNPQTLELLNHVANNDPDEKLKKFAQQELAKLSK